MLRISHKSVRGVCGWGHCTAGVPDVHFTPIMIMIDVSARLIQDTSWSNPLHPRHSSPVLVFVLLDLHTSYRNVL